MYATKAAIQIAKDESDMRLRVSHHGGGLGSALTLFSKIKLNGVLMLLHQPRAFPFSA